ncbi:MAG: DUF4332 domain-containing protein [Cyanobacteriota bacterium]|nr:DUF4332 domain-containing protein [Cyanobacteriota bacterium]
MNYNIREIEGIDLVHANKLAEVGITTLEELLEKGSSLKDIEDLERVTEIDRNLILEWVQLADLFQIKGVAEEYSKLLEAVGVHTVEELKSQYPETLYSKMVKANRKERIVDKLPSLGMVRSWVSQAINNQQVPSEKLDSKSTVNDSKWSLEWAD